MSGTESFPRNGPVLVMSNHVSLMDPAILIVLCRRPIHWLASQAAMRDAMLALVMRLYGAVPTQKQLPDPRAIRQLRAWARLGEAVGVFPEGERSWDGRRLPLLPGIERLVRIIGAPVVTARLHNAHRRSPRWAEHSRVGRILVEFDPPRTFDGRAGPDEIRAYIQDRITIDAKERTWPVRGRRLARGLANMLFACPSCGSVGSLVETDDDVCCRECGARWRVTPDLDLVLQPDGSRLGIRDAVDRAHVSATRTWEARAHAGAIVLASESLELIDVTSDEPETLGRGTLVLTPDRLSFNDAASGKSLWKMPLSQLLAVTVDLRRRLQLHFGHQVVEPVMPSESVLKWQHAIDHLRHE